MQPRGIRNNNPGNIRLSGDKWQGLAEVQEDPAFFTFKSPTYGIRAMARILIAYQDRHGLDTVEGIVRRWAPPSENDTDAYIRHVSDLMSDACECLDVDPDEVIDVHDYHTMRPLVEAMIRHENGVQPYSGKQIDKGLVLAGVEPEERKSLQECRTVKGAQVAAGGAGLGVVGSLVEEVAPALPFLQTALQYAPWLVALIVLAGVGYVVHARRDDLLRGLR